MPHNPPKVEFVYVVVRQDDQPAGYRPSSRERRSKKFWSRVEAIKLFNQHRGNAKLFVAKVGDWEEINPS